MQLLKNRALAVAVGAGVLVTGANLTAYAAGGHAFFGAHHTSSPARSGHTSAGAHVYEYVVPPHTPLAYTFQAKGLPKGRYAVSLNLAEKSVPPVGPPAPLEIPFCFVAGSGNPYAVFSYGVYSGDPDPGNGADVAINTGSGLVTAAKKGGVTFGCEGGSKTYNSRGSHNIVVFTPLSQVTKGKVKSVLMMRSGMKDSHFAR